MKKTIFIILLFSVYSFGQGKILRQIDSTAQRTFSDLKYVDKTTAQTITAEKTFENTVVFNDSNFAAIKINGLTGYGDWWWRFGNHYVNTAPRPDQVMHLGYNVSNGGGLQRAGEPAISLMMESYYDGNGGIPAQELHLAFIDTNSVQHRVFTSFFNTNTNKANLGLNADVIYMAEDDGSIIWQMSNNSIQYYQPYFSMYPNNSSMIANWNKDSTAWVYLPYIDNNDRYTFGNIDTVTAGNPFLHLYQMDLRFDNAYGFSSYNSGGTLTKNFYYDSDELRIQADTTEPVKIRASNLYFEDSEGGLTDIMNPALPFDTTGLEAGQKYIDPNTGLVLMRIGESLVSNGDFSSWTWDATSFRHPTGWVKQFIGDTTQTYIENVSDQLHIVSDGSARLAYLYNASSLDIGETYVYAFNLVGFNADSLSFQIGGVPLNPNYTTLSTGYKTGEITATGVGMFTFDCQLASADVTIDNLRIWKKTDGAIQAVAKIILVPDTTGITDGYVQKYVGGNVVWSPDISTSGTGTFNPDGVTIDTTAGGLARVLPAKVTKWDSVTTKQNADADLTIYAGITPSANVQTFLGYADFAAMRTGLGLVIGTNVQAFDADLTDLADGELTASKVGGVKDADYGDVTVSSGIWSIEDDSHNHTIFADTFRVAGWGVMDTVTTGDYIGIKIENNYTITEVSAYTNSGTVTFNIEERVETTPNTAGVDVMTSDLVADTDQQETSTFSNAAIDRDDWLVLVVTSITGDPTIFSVTVRGVKTN